MGFNQERFKITCCKDCPDRYPGCHGKCEKYIQQKLDHDAKKAESMKRFEVACGLYDQKRQSVYKASARRRYRDKYR